MLDTMLVVRDTGAPWAYLGAPILHVCGNLSQSNGVDGSKKKK